MDEPMAARQGDGDVTTFAIGNINPGLVRSELMQALLALNGAGEQTHPSGRRTKVTELLVKVHGPYLDVGRNFIVVKFLESDADVLLFVDSDMEPTTEQIHSIVAKVSPTAPVIGGLYVNWFADHGVKPVALNWNDTLTQMEPIEMPTDDKLVSVGCVGTGFMAIHRSLLETMQGVWESPSPWFAEVALNGSQMGEDVTFCQRVISMGFPVLLDPSIRVPHHKHFRFTPESFPAAQPEEQLTNA